MYIQHYPGFLKKSVHPKGLCVPCCFSYKLKDGKYSETNGIKDIGAQQETLRDTCDIKYPDNLSLDNEDGKKKDNTQIKPGRFKLYYVTTKISIA